MLMLCLQLFGSYIVITIPSALLLLVMTALYLYCSFFVLRYVDRMIS